MCVQANPCGPPWLSSTWNVRQWPVLFSYCRAFWFTLCNTSLPVDKLVVYILSMTLTVPEFRLGTGTFYSGNIFMNTTLVFLWFPRAWRCLTWISSLVMLAWMPVGSFFRGIFPRNFSTFYCSSSFKHKPIRTAHYPRFSQFVVGSITCVFSVMIV